MIFKSGPSTSYHRQNLPVRSSFSRRRES